MLTVCNKHVNIALQELTVPHVKKIKFSNCMCLFCKEEATIKLYYPTPFSRKNISLT